MFYYKYVSGMYADSYQVYDANDVLICLVLDESGAEMVCSLLNNR